MAHPSLYTVGAHPPPSPAPWVQGTYRKYFLTRTGLSQQNLPSPNLGLLPGATQPSRGPARATSTHLALQIEVRASVWQIGMGAGNPSASRWLSSSPLPQRLSAGPTMPTIHTRAAPSTRCAPATTWTSSLPSSSASMSSPCPWSTTTSLRWPEAGVGLGRGSSAGRGGATTHQGPASQCGH